MKTIPYLIGTALTALLAGCASPALVLAPVGPNPAGLTRDNPNGQLEVFSALTAQAEGDNPTWYQHTDYYLDSPQGKELRHVDNAIGYYATAPRIISLPAGHYLVKARAKGYLWITVPVVVEAGRTTKVHLDKNWQAPENTPQTEVVDIPGGYPVGWSSSPMNPVSGEH